MKYINADFNIIMLNTAHDDTRCLEQGLQGQCRCREIWMDGQMERETERLECFYFEVKVLQI